MSENAPALVMGFESSCDETACAILQDGHRLLASQIASQVDEHARFGGVVPEVASRQHLAALFPLVERTLADAQLTLADIDAFAVTRAPGLIGALLVGVSAAKALAFALDKPLVGVNHLEAHLLAARLLASPPAFPYLGLIVSGGHTALYVVEDGGRFTLLGNTRDDAAGEAFDKVAKLLGLGYPGGIAIERMAQSGDPDAIAFPRALKAKTTLDFSFSGLKTAVRSYLQTHPATPESLPDICASFQEAAVDALVRKSVQALKQHRLQRLVLAGGVAANTRLREHASKAARRIGVECYLPERWHCTDNAAMVALAGFERLKRGERADATLNAAASEHRF